MVSKTLYQWKRSLGRFICSLALAFFGALTARSQEEPGSPQAPAGEQTDQLQQQLQQLKQQYDATTRELTQRIATLEQEIQEQKEKQEKDAPQKAKQGTTSAAELAAQQAAQDAAFGESDEVGAKFHSDKAWMRTEVMIGANTTNSTSYANFPNGVGDDQFRLREVFVQAGNVLDSQPAKFWVGERYYRRQHIEKPNSERYAKA